MKVRFRQAFFAFVFSASTTLASAAIDQQQTIWDHTLGVAGGEPSQLGQYAQSFKQAASNISGVSVLLDNQNYGHPLLGGDLTFNVWDGLDVGSARLLGSVKVSVDTTNLPNPQSSPHSVWVEGHFAAPIIVTPDTPYFLRFESTPGSNFVLHYSAASNSYTRGVMTYAGGTGVFGASTDLAFKTYSQPATSAVPEPESFALMFGGFGVLAAVKRRRAT